MREETFRPSRMKALFLAVACTTGWAATYYFLNGQSPLQALALGGVPGKLALANIVFTVLIPLAAFKAVLRPASLTLNAQGISERGIFGKFHCDWNDVLQIELLKFSGNTFVQIRTANKVKQLSPGYGPSPSALINILEKHRLAATRN